MEQGFLSQGEDIESDLMQALRIQVVPSVKHERRFYHFIMYPLEIKVPVFLPLGDQGNGMGSLAGLVYVFHECCVALHTTQILSGIFEGFWIMNPNPRLLLQELTGLPQVGRVGEEDLRDLPETRLVIIIVAHPPCQPFTTHPPSYDHRWSSLI